MNFVILGAGSWGIALGMLLSKKGHSGWLWDGNTEWLNLLSKQRVHPRLKQALPDQLGVATDLIQPMQQAEVILGATTCGDLRAACQVAAPYYQGQLFISCSKGIEKESFKLPHQIVRESLGKQAIGKIVVLTGPSHAEEVARDLPTAILLAGESVEVALKARQFLASPQFFPHISTDITGAELGGAFKNVVAIACGINDGIRGGDNAQAALITIGLQEMCLLGQAMGAEVTTMYGLGGLGDLLVTCSSIHSRNRRFGKFLGEGSTAEQALAKVGMVVEGAYTVETAVKLVEKYRIKAPLIEGVAALLNNQISADKMIYQLLGS